MRTISNTPEEMPDNVTHRPLVTFALFAYNQENYVREAVEGAFAQTYEPLEIILSDDCSNDRTFAIMQEMAAAYNGPHEVRVRRTEVNKGIGAHVQNVLGSAKGKFFVMAAGDDVSDKNRVQILTEGFTLNPDRFCACSYMYSYKDNSIKQVNPPQRPDDLLQRIKYIIGAAAAYRSDVIKQFPELLPAMHHEDDALTLRALLLGSGCIHIKQPLVTYRDEGVSNSYMIPGAKSKYRTRSKVEIERRIVLCAQWRSDLEKMRRGDLISQMEDFENYNKFIFDLITSSQFSVSIFRNLSKIRFKEFIFEYLKYRHPTMFKAVTAMRGMP
jgi:glycosyltransferase involved in cell wall biosynthesis